MKKTIINDWPALEENCGDICYSIAYPVLGHKIDGFEINPNDPKYILRKRDKVFVKMIDESTMQKYENPSNLEVVVY